MPAGTYRITVGPLFYFGSTTDMTKRKLDHQWRLRAGKHPITRLQEAFTAGEEFAFHPIEPLRQLPQEPRAKFNSRLRAKEQKLLNQHKSDPNLCNRSTNARGPDATQAKDRWALPGYREKVATSLARRPEPTKEARAKMAQAKTGDNNPRSRAVIVTNPDGSTTRHESTAIAARFFNVTQQCLDQWLKGETAWPGTGRRTQAKNLWIVPYRAAFEDMPSAPRTFSTVG